MKKLRAFYFSGTGNTKFVTEFLLDKLSCAFDVKAWDIMGKCDFAREIGEADVVLIAFPIYGSAPPIPMRNFAVKYSAQLRGKTVAIAETQYFFSGDGAASIGRTLQKNGAIVAYAEHFNMPNNLADNSFFKVRNGGELHGIMDKVTHRMEAFANKIISGKKFRRGFNPLSHAVGYYGQRKWWRLHENAKRSQLKVDSNRCVGCGLCVKNCPTNNLILGDGCAKGQDRCVFCYRCINLCPKNAITLFGSKVVSQYKGISNSNGLKH